MVTTDCGNGHWHLLKNNYRRTALVIFRVIYKKELGISVKTLCNTSNSTMTSIPGWLL